MSRRHKGDGDGRLVAEAVDPVRVCAHFGWRYAVVYDYGSATAVEDVCFCRANAEDLARTLNAGRGDGARVYKVAPVRGVV